MHGDASSSMNSRCSQSGGVWLSDEKRAAPAFRRAICVHAAVIGVPGDWGCAAGERWGDPH